MSASAETDKDNSPSFDASAVISGELGLPDGSVRAVVRLMAEGATVPFIARYRKEATGGLDEVQIRNVDERRGYLIELEARRSSVLAEIGAQGKLTPELRAKLSHVPTKAELEDLYLPYKPKRRTRATIAAERGLEPLAELIWEQAAGEAPSQAAARFVTPEREVAGRWPRRSPARATSAPSGSRTTPSCASTCARRTSSEGAIRVEKRTEHQDKATKFDTYASYEEPVAQMPSHRFLAIRRGETEDVLCARVLCDMTPHQPYVKSRVPIRRRLALGGGARAGRGRRVRATARAPGARSTCASS